MHAKAALADALVEHELPSGASVEGGGLRGKIVLSQRGAIPFVEKAQRVAVCNHPPTHSANGLVSFIEPISSFCFCSVREASPWLSSMMVSVLGTINAAYPAQTSQVEKVLELRMFRLIGKSYMAHLC